MFPANVDELRCPARHALAGLGTAAASLLLAMLLLCAQGRPAASAESRIPGLGTLQDVAQWVSARRARAGQRVLHLEGILQARLREHREATQRLAVVLGRNTTLLAARRALLAGAADAHGVPDAHHRRASATDRVLALAIRSRDEKQSPQAVVHLRAILAGIDRSDDAMAGSAASLAGHEQELASRLATLGHELRQRNAELATARRALLDVERERDQMLSRKAALGRQLAELAERTELDRTAATLHAGRSPGLSIEVETGPLLRASLALEEQLLVSVRTSLPAPAPQRALAAFGPQRVGAQEMARPAAFVLPIAGGRAVADGSEARHDRRGLLLASPVPQTVSAPCDGEIAFAEPFKGFGLLLIIDRGDGYHILLSGLSHLGVRRGARVMAGQAVGAIGAGGGAGRLYLELRRHGSPVDAAVWLALLEDKVRS